MTGTLIQKIEGQLTVGVVGDADDKEVVDAVNRLGYIETNVYSREESEIASFKKRYTEYVFPFIRELNGRWESEAPTYYREGYYHCYGLADVDDMEEDANIALNSIKGFDGAWLENVKTTVIEFDSKGNRI